MPAVKFDTSKTPAQRAFMEARESELLYSGAFGAGKTRVGNEKGYFLSLKYPGNRGLICRKTYTDLRDTTMDSFFRYVCVPEHVRNWAKNEHRLTLHNGSEILFHGLDTPTKVASLEVGWIFVDEIIELTEEDYMMLLGRLRHPVPFHQIFGATNPASPSHWLYKRFYQDQDLKKRGVTAVVEASALDNPYTPETYKQRLKDFKGRYRERYVEGRWVSFEGLVYDVWEPSRHILPRNSRLHGLTGDPANPIPSDWDRYRVIDFGFTNPFVCQWWASPTHRYVGDPGRQDRQPIPLNERTWFMYREIYMSGVPITDHAEEIRRLSHGERVLATYADWDAGDRFLLERAGIPTSRAVKDVQAGIQSVYEAIADNRVFILQDSLVRQDLDLLAANKPTCTVEEFPSYVRQHGKSGVRDPKENPQKLNDHGMDCIRMLLHTLKMRYYPEGSVQIGRRESTRPGTPGMVVPLYANLRRKYASASRPSWRKYA